MKASLPIPLIFVMLVIALLASCTKGNFHHENTSEGIRILEDGQPVLFYQSKTKSLSGKYPRANYIHPLYSLGGGVFTEDFPDDHFHHRGIFWTWHQVWIGQKRTGDAWICRDFIWDVKKADIEYQGGNAVLNTQVFWKSPMWIDESGKMKEFAIETANITLFPRSDNYRILDLAIQIRSLVDSLYIGGSEDDKGYGGFSARIKLPEDVRFEDKDGQVTPKRLAVAAGPWMNISGSFFEQDSLAGIALVSHPFNPGYPEPWILRAKNSMQNLKFPGREKYHIPQDTPLRLKYRIVVHRIPDNEELKALIQQMEW